jgi:hypothetical protein
MLLALALGLGWLGWKVPGLRLVLKASGLVGTVAKGLTRGVAATAECNGFAAAKSVRLPFHIDEFHYAFDAQWSVIADRDFC